MSDILGEKELEEVAELISKTVVPEIVRIADTYNYDRDSLIKYIADMFSAMAELATFEHWQTESKSDVLDKIRAEIVEDIEKYSDIYDDTCHGLRMALDIIDKYAKGITK